VKIRLLLLVALTMLLAACAEMPSVQTEYTPDLPRWQYHVDQISELHSWKVSGRLSVTTPQQNWTATMHWQQVNDAYQIRFIAPLGQGTYEIRGNDEAVFIRTAKNEIYQADTPEELLSKNLGWEVNLASLAYWVRGIPDPNESTNQLLLNEDNLLSVMEQHGFRISVLRYQDVDGKSLPGKIFLHSDKIKLKMVIQTWDLG